MSSTNADTGRDATGAITTRLVRTVRGTVVHRRECMMAQRGGAEPWLWAENVRPSVLAKMAPMYGWRPCRRCNPFPFGTAFPKT